VGPNRHAKLADDGDRMLPENLNRVYTDFFETTADNTILSKKTTVMVQLAASFALGCYP
jgi:hypothetical protein